MTGVITPHLGDWLNPPSGIILQPTTQCVANLPHVRAAHRMHLTLAIMVSLPSGQGHGQFFARKKNRGFTGGQQQNKGQWIGLRENFNRKHPETIDLPIKYGVFSCQLSLKPIHWKGDKTKTQEMFFSTTSFAGEDSPKNHPSHKPSCCRFPFAWHGQTRKQVRDGKPTAAGD